MPHKWDSGQIASKIFASVILTLCEFNDCCNKRILKLQPDFIKQKSLVQETTKAAGLMPILTQISLWIKSHWVLLGYGKKYLCDHCDYLFEGLNDNLLKALELVQIQTIQWWGNWFFHWVEAYCLGLGSVEAHAHVKKYTFKQFTSHRYVSKRVAATFGWCMSTVVSSVQGWPNWFMLKSLLPQSQSN